MNSTHQTFKTVKFITSVLVAGLSCSAFPVQGENTERDFGFQPLEIYKFKMGTSRLLVTDINNDGLDDIIFANNHVSRLEILIRKPDTGETLDDLPELDERFEDRGMIVDQGIKALRIGDLNNDGLKDIVTFGTTIGLHVRYQNSDGSFQSPEHIFIKSPSTVTTIQLGDLNQDGLIDILASHRNEAELLWNAKTKPFMDKKTLTFAGDKSFFGDIADVNKDGIPDLAFHFNTTRNPFKVRYGKGNGVFGTEQPVDLPPRQYMDILQSENIDAKVGMVLRNRLAFRLYDFIEKEQPQLMEAQEVSPSRIGLEGTSKKDNPAWVAGDFNHDGMDDLLVAAPELSRLHLYFGTETGLNPTPEKIDTLSDVVRMSRTSTGDILVLSQKERIAALHKADDLKKFPAIQKLPGDVLAASAVESNGEIWFTCKNSDKELLLVKQSDGEEHEVFYLDGMKNDPEDMLAFSLPGGRTGIIFFMAYDTPRMQLYDGEYIEPITSESFRALTQRIALSNIQLENPGDGTVITVSQGAIARRFKWVNDRYEVIRQFNPENPRGEMIASTSYTLLDGSTGTFFYDRNSGDLVRFAETGDDWGKIHIPDADQTIFDLVQLRHPKRDLIIMLDRTGLNEVMGNGTQLDLEVAAEYVSPSENALLAYAKLVKLGSPARPMVALVDPSNRSVELISQQGDELKTELVFEVFLTSDFADVGKTRGTEPHDVESGDLNGDGIGDLVILAHDKLLIYLGE
ncbi:hypothetical protein EGM51_16785 [Verrucomicrobia bacterium S94]|nr:hypothetical protein EGM51_16785 [Verrucomicrobia bacterium S94]